MGKNSWDLNVERGGTLGAKYLRAWARSQEDGKEMRRMERASRRRGGGEEEGTIAFIPHALSLCGLPSLPVPLLTVTADEACRYFAIALSLHIARYCCALRAEWDSGFRVMKPGLLCCDARKDGEDSFGMSVFICHTTSLRFLQDRSRQDLTKLCH
jgi:hypothetical protein